MNKKLLIEKLAMTAVKIGVNVQKDQLVYVNAPTEAVELVREITRQAYLAGAGRVLINWNDPYISNYGLNFMDIEKLKVIPKWAVDKLKDVIDKKACIISVASPIPNLNKDVDPEKLQTVEMASKKAMGFYLDYVIASKGQWTILAAANPVWANKVFPDLNENDGLEALWKGIFDTSRVREDSDPVEEWKKHNAALAHRDKILNNYNFESLHFTNKLGTDIKVGLVEDHVWLGGGEHTQDGVYFNPNIPTEENFTMPHKDKVNGKVVATKPLSYQGKLIENFWIEFKDGEIVAYDAKKNKDALDNLLKVDEGVKRLGEIALISYDSPISKSGILFYNTLFDENASCHMALGRAIPINIKGGTEMSLDDLKAKGYNHSMTHIDFMFGSEDMSITGTTHDGKEVVVFKDGNFVI